MLSLFESSPQKALTSQAFIDHVVGFSAFGSATQIQQDSGITYYSNAFWTAQQRQAHSLHEVSYRACFKPQLPEFFIRYLTAAHAVVYDPFMGRGTTLIQAALMGRKPVGNDINPLSKLLARPRLAPPLRLNDIAAALASVNWEAGRIQREDLLAFYHPNTLKQLEALRLWLAERAPLSEDHPDRAADWVRMVALNRLSGHSPGFFSGRSMPPNQAVSIRSQLVINQRLGQVPPERDVPTLILKKTRALLRDNWPQFEHLPQLYSASAWQVEALAEASVDLVVSSPPFLDVVDYAADNWLRCWFAGIDMDTLTLDIHTSQTAWQLMVNRVLQELARVVKPGGHVAFEVGEVRGGKVLLEKLVWQAAELWPFERLGVMVNTQNFTKTAHCWGVGNNAGGTNTNRIVVLRRKTTQ